MTFKEHFVAWAHRMKQMHELEAAAFAKLISELRDAEPDDVVIAPGGIVQSQTSEIKQTDAKWLDAPPSVPPPPFPSSSGRPNGPSCFCGQPSTLWTSKDGRVKMWYCGKRKGDPSKCEFKRKAEA